MTCEAAVGQEVMQGRGRATRGNATTSRQTRGKWEETCQWTRGVGASIGQGCVSRGGGRDERTRGREIWHQCNNQPENKRRPQRWRRQRQWPQEMPHAAITGLGNNRPHAHCGQHQWRQWRHCHHQLHFLAARAG